MKTHSYRHFLLTLSCQVVAKVHIYKLKESCREKLQSCLNVRDFLLPPGINGINSHKNHYMTSRPNHQLH